jgi:hypothetical protein
MNQIKRRPNPFDTRETTPKAQEPTHVTPTSDFEQRPTTRQPQKIVQTPVTNVEVREKYTSTMDQELRKKIKIACAMKGIMFSQFIEEACIEKLTREGMM